MLRIVIYAIVLAAAVSVACLCFAMAAESGRRAVETFRQRRTTPLGEAVAVLGIAAIIAGAVFALNAAPPSARITAGHETTRTQVMIPDDSAKPGVYRTDGGQ